MHLARLAMIIALNALLDRCLDLRFDPDANEISVIPSRVADADIRLVPYTGRD
jgi:hypothetical protein